MLRGRELGTGGSGSKVGFRGGGEFAEACECDGCDDEGCDNYFWSAKDKNRCIYEKISLLYY